MRCSPPSSASSDDRRGRDGSSPYRAQRPARARPGRDRRRLCGGCRPTTSTSTSCTASTPRSRSRRPGARWPSSVAAGKARVIGLSEVTVAEIERARPSTPWRPSSPSCRSGRATRSTRCVPCCAQHGIAFLPFAPLGRGFLTGRLRRPTSFAVGTSAAGAALQRRRCARTCAIVERIRTVAERVDATPAQVALAWVLAQGEHVVPIPAPRPRGTWPRTPPPRRSAQRAGPRRARRSARPVGGRY